MPLIRREGTWPSGGYAYTDPRSGMKFNGTEATFDGQVARIIQHRLSNFGKGKLYDPDREGDGKYIDVSYVNQQLDDYTCLRLGNDRRFCIGTDEPEKLRLREKYYQQKDLRVCPKCTATMNEKLCETCGGRRVIGLTCPACQFEILR